HHCACLFTSSTHFAIRTFFLESSRAHPALHSFPTRRSSDLDVTDIETAKPKIHFTDDAGQPGTIEADIVVGADGSRSFCQLQYRDRKSTRLNSSHVSISYAVFCLKKKKQSNT